MTVSEHSNSGLESKAHQGIDLKESDLFPEEKSVDLIQEAVTLNR